MNDLKPYGWDESNQSIPAPDLATKKALLELASRPRNNSTYDLLGLIFWFFFFATMIFGGCQG